MLEDAPCDIIWQSNGDVGNIEQLLALVLDGLSIRTDFVGFISLTHRESGTVNMFIDILNRTIGDISFQTSYPGILEKYYDKFDTERLVVDGLWLRSGIDRTVWNIDGKQKITIYTDHKPITYLIKKKDPKGRIYRWLTTLQEYNLEIEYLRGEENIRADFSADQCQRYISFQIMKISLKNM